MILVLLVSFLFAPTLAGAKGKEKGKEVVLQFRSLEDPQGTPDFSVCAAAAFPVNAVMAAKLFPLQEHAPDGRDGGKDQVQIGGGTACIQVTDVTFPPFSSHPIYAEFTVDGQTMRISGVCTVTSNDTPLSGAVLAGCVTSVVEAPQGFVGGLATGNSVFNPFHLPGLSTGSLWTVRLYPE